MFNQILQIVGYLGLGAILGIFVQYFISKRLKIFETRLIIFRRLYKKLYHALLLSGANSGDISRPFGGESSIQQIRLKCDLDLKGDLGDILFYINGELYDRINMLINVLYSDCNSTVSAGFIADDIKNILAIQDILKNTFKTESSFLSKLKNFILPIKPPLQVLITRKFK